MNFNDDKFKDFAAHRRINDQGEYVFPTKTKYIGAMKDGAFHGKGYLLFPSGSRFTGTWEAGRAIQGVCTFEDGLECDTLLQNYCKLSDRRFYNERRHGIKPAGKSHLANEHPPLIIPAGCYDCGDGFYNPKTRVVYTRDDKFIRNADDEEHEWIVRTCRSAWLKVAHPENTDKPAVVNEETLVGMQAPEESAKGVMGATNEVVEVTSGALLEQLEPGGGYGES